MQDRLVEPSHSVSSTEGLENWVREQEAAGTARSEILHGLLNHYLVTLCRFDVDAPRACRIFRDLSESFPQVKARWRAADELQDSQFEMASVHPFHRRHGNQNQALLTNKPARVFGLPWQTFFVMLCLAAWGVVLAIIIGYQSLF